MVGVNYIKPLQGGFAALDNIGSSRLATSPRPDAPTVLLPLIGEPMGTSEPAERVGHGCAPAIAASTRDNARKLMVAA